MNEESKFTKVFCKQLITNTIKGIFLFYNNNYTFTAAPQGTYTYTLEVWGAQGGNSILANQTAYGGKGGYAKGTKSAAANTEWYICVGSAGEQGTPAVCKQNSQGRPYGGYNGGRQGGWFEPLQTTWSGSGGATHIAQTTKRGVLKNYANNKSEVLIVAGAGGGAGLEYKSSTNPKASEMNIRAGGYGGGAIGGSGNSPEGAPVAGGGTQTAGGQGYDGNVASASASGSFGNGGRRTSVDSSCGGGGWYGGGAANNSVSTGAGGSSYIGGVNNGSTIAGNATQTKPGGGTETGHSGNGYARITLTRW